MVTALESLTRNGGSMAQFSHPEMGGGCQWMRGGMTMVGDMFNHGLKARVDHLLTDLSSQMTRSNLFAPPPAASSSADAGSTYAAPAFSGGGQGMSGNWWPPEFGMPSSTGGQNDIRYAVFPATRRLVIDRNGHITVYDSLNHQISGVSQQQGSGSSLLFTSQYGYVRVDDLPTIPARW